MCEVKHIYRILFVWIIIAQTICFTKTENSTECVLPILPPNGWWSLINKPSKFPSWSEAPANTMLNIQCENTYKLDGCAIIACINGTWFPPIGRCLKTCPSIYSTSKMKVTCIFKEQQTGNCTEPLEGTLAQFKCASFYEDPRISKSKAVCVDGKWSENAPDCSPVCGRATVKKRPTLIVGGDATKKGQFPWQIALYTIIDKKLICGGTLLSEKVVLTAAHCVTDLNGDILPKDEYVVVAGKYYRKFDHPQDSKYIQVSEIHDMFVSEEYEGENQNYVGDIAVIITKKSLKFSIRIQPVCIDWSRKYENVVIDSDKQKGYVTGWGYTRENAEPSNELKSIRVPSISRKKCRRIIPDNYRRYMTYDKFCAGYRNNGTSVCGGDSGGGLVFKRDGRFFIAGIVSLAPLARTRVGGCDSQQYGLYTFVYNYTDNFILKKLAEFKKPETKEEGCRYCHFTTQKPTSYLPPQNYLPPLPPWLTEKPPPKRPPPPPRTQPPSPVTPSQARPTPPQTQPPPLDRCILPLTESGQWSLLAVDTHKPHLLFAGISVVKGASIRVDCDEGYDYDRDSPLNICMSNGKWTHPFGKCRKKCPLFDNSTKMNVTCTHKKRNVEDCHEAPHGTTAKVECAEFYEFSSKATKPSVCLDGKWSSVPECIPGCGQASDTSKRNFPWHVALYRSENNMKNLICGGSLINKKIIITAAHCITDTQGNLLPKEEFVVAAGKYHRQLDHPEDSQAQFSKVDKMITSGQYKGDVQNYFADIAIIILEKPFVLSTNVQPICIDWGNSLGLPTNKPAFSNGWGLSKFGGKPADVLTDQKFSIISNLECSDELSEDYESFLTYDKFCGTLLRNGEWLLRAFQKSRTSFVDSSVCTTETGGGLFTQRSNRYYLIGVLSLSLDQDEEDCSNQQYVLFTKMETYVNTLVLEAEARYRN